MKVAIGAIFVIVSQLIPVTSMGRPVADIGLVVRHEGRGTLGTQSVHHNPQKACQVSGQIIDVIEYTPSRGSAKGVYLSLSSHDKEVTVHLGPKWYVSQLPISFTIGDYISVIGFEGNIQDETVVIAQEILHPQGRYSLRDSRGGALWTGR